MKSKFILLSVCVSLSFFGLENLQAQCYDTSWGYEPATGAPAQQSEWWDRKISDPNDAEISLEDENDIGEGQRPQTADNRKEEKRVEEANQHLDQWLEKETPDQTAARKADVERSASTLGSFKFPSSWGVTNAKNSNSSGGALSSISRWLGY